jgi:hypothetical protein
LDNIAKYFDEPFSVEQLILCAAGNSGVRYKLGSVLNMLKEQTSQLKNCVPKMEAVKFHSQKSLAGNE